MTDDALIRSLLALSRYWLNWSLGGIAHRTEYVLWKDVEALLARHSIADPLVSAADHDEGGDVSDHDDLCVICKQHRLHHFDVKYPARTIKLEACGDYEENLMPQNKVPTDAD
jgi:hypothetical protein